MGALGLLGQAVVQIAEHGAMACFQAMIQRGGQRSLSVRQRVEFISQPDKDGQDERNTQAKHDFEHVFSNVKAGL